MNQLPGNQHSKEERLKKTLSMSYLMTLRAKCVYSICSRCHNPWHSEKQILTVKLRGLILDTLRGNFLKSN